MSMCSVRKHIEWKLILVFAIHLTIPAVQAPAQQRIARVADQPTLETARTLTRPVSVYLEHLSLRGAIDRIAAAADVQIQYRDVVIDQVTTRITIRAEGLPLGAVLDRVLAGTTLQAVPTAPGLITIRPADYFIVLNGTIVGKVVHAKTGSR